MLLINLRKASFYDYSKQNRNRFFYFLSIIWPINLFWKCLISLNWYYSELDHEILLLMLCFQFYMIQISLLATKCNTGIWPADVFIHGPWHKFTLFVIVSYYNVFINIRQQQTLIQNVTKRAGHHCPAFLDNFSHCDSLKALIGFLTLLRLMSVTLPLLFFNFLFLYLLWLSL